MIDLDVIVEHLEEHTMTRYDLLQTLEMIFPNKEENDSWFVASEDEGIVRIAFVVDIEEGE